MLTPEEFQDAIRNRNNYFFLRKPNSTVGPLMVMVGREPTITPLGQPFLMHSRCQFEVITLLLDALSIMIQADHEHEIKVLARIIFGEFVPVSPVPDKELAVWLQRYIPNAEVVRAEWAIWANTLNLNFSGQVFKTFINLSKC